MTGEVPGALMREDGPDEFIPRETMMTAAFTETDERLSLRLEVAKLAGGYGREFFVRQARSGGKTTDLWLDMGRHGYLGVAIPEEYGGGGGGIGDLAAVCEELAAQGCPLLMMIVSPAGSARRHRRSAGCPASPTAA